MVVVLDNLTTNSTTTMTTAAKRRRIGGQLERFCPNGHNIDRGYPLWYRKRIGNLPDATILCRTCRSVGSCGSSTTTTTTMEQDDDVTWSCIDCDFDMCTKCYTSKHPMDDLFLRLDQTSLDLSTISEHVFNMNHDRMSLTNTGNMGELGGNK